MTLVGYGPIAIHLHVKIPLVRPACTDSAEHLMSRRSSAFHAVLQKSGLSILRKDGGATKDGVHLGIVLVVTSMKKTWKAWSRTR